MHKRMENAICQALDLQEKALCCALSGQYEIDSNPMYMLVDIIKDMSEVIVNNAKACKEESEKKVFEEEARRDPELMRMGYDKWRYSSGQFAPKGHGHMGYDLYSDNPLMGGPYNPMKDGRMGYQDNTGMSYGTSYDGYRKARRHYSETKSKEDKDQMDMHAKHHMYEVTNSLRDIWNNADPELKKELKTDMTQFVNDLKA